MLVCAFRYRFKFRKCNMLTATPLATLVFAMAIGRA
jgi:hypothetical protein